MCMHEPQRAPTSGILGPVPQRKISDFRPSEAVSDAILSNMAETCCEIAIVCANYIVDSRRDIRSHV